MLDQLKEQNGLGPLTDLELHTMNEVTQIISDLKRENFNLKLRIYFYEERLQQNFDDSVEDIYKTNITLKADIVSVKEELKELRDKNTALDKQRDSYRRKDMEWSCTEVENRTSVLEKERMPIVELENKILANRESDTFTLADPSPDKKCQDLINKLEERELLIEQLQASIKSQEATIDQLRNGSVAQGSGDQQTTDPSLQHPSLIDLKVLEQENRERWKLDKQLKEMQDLLERSNEEMAERQRLIANRNVLLKVQETTIQELNKSLLEKDQLLLSTNADTAIVAQLQAGLLEKENELHTLNNLLYSHEDTINSLENELADQKIKYNSKTKQLEDALEQNNEELSNSSFMLAEHDIKLKEQKADLKEKEALINSLRSSLVKRDYLKEEAVLQQHLMHLKETSKALKLEQKIETLPSDNGFLTNIENAITGAKAEILNAIQGHSNKTSSKLCLVLEKLTELQDRNSPLTSYQDLIKNIGESQRQRNQDVDQTWETFEQTVKTRKQHEESLSHSLQEKDSTIAQLEFTVNSQAKDMEIMVRQLQCQAEENQKEMCTLERSLKETERMLDKVNAEKQTHLASHKVSVEKFQSVITMNAEVITAVESLMNNIDKDVFPVTEIVTHLQRAKGAFKRHFSEIIQAKEYMISQLQLQHVRKSQNLELMVRHLQKQVVESNNEIEVLEMQLEEKERQVKCLELVETNQQARDEDGCQKVELLEMNLRKMHNDEPELQENPSSKEKLWNQTEDKNRTFEQGEQKAPLLFKGRETFTAQFPRVLTNTKIPVKEPFASCPHSQKMNAILQNQTQFCRDITSKKEEDMDSSFILSFTVDTKSEEIQPSSVAKVTQNQGEAVEIERLIDRLNKSIMGSLNPADDEITRFKQDVDATRKNLLKNKESLKSICQVMQESKQTTVPVIPYQATEFWIIFQDEPTFTNLLSEIEKIKEHVSSKSETPTREKYEGFNSCEGYTINIKYVQCGGFKNTGNRNTAQSIWDPKTKPCVAFLEEDCLALQELIFELKTLVNKMIQLLQKNMDNKALSSQSQSKDLYLENKGLAREIERMRMEQIRSKKMLSESLKRLKKVNRTKLARLS